MILFCFVCLSLSRSLAGSTVNRFWPEDSSEWWTDTAFVGFDQQRFVLLLFSVSDHRDSIQYHQLIGTRKDQSLMWWIPLHHPDEATSSQQPTLNPIRSQISSVQIYLVLKTFIEETTDNKQSNLVAVIHRHAKQSLSFLIKPVCAYWAFTSDKLIQSVNIGWL